MGCKAQRWVHGLRASLAACLSLPAGI
jgi:hypothetical protein